MCVRPECANYFDDAHRCHLARSRSRGHACWRRPPDRQRGASLRCSPGTSRLPLCQCTRIKLLAHEGFGVWCATRRLSQGRFVWPGGGVPLQQSTLTQAQFDALIGGLPWQRLAQVQAIKRV
ncbi:transposase [Acidovorax radicis]|uniref:transposase n=1 Tax=Acidovorax radicis TaxID=758826 RepID=UPI001CFC2BA3|nr:transposase [Acidovorax radicis]